MRTAVLIASLLGILLCGYAGSPQEEFRYYGSLFSVYRGNQTPVSVPLFFRRDIF